MFRTIFRGTGYGFAKDSDFSHVSKDPKYWDKVNEKFYTKYHGLDKWHQELGKICAESGSYTNPFGRYWNFKMGVDYKQEPKIPWSVITNYPVQGTGADMVACARIILNKKLKENNIKGHICLTVHDSIVVDCPENEVDIVAKLMYDSFNELDIYIKETFNVDLPFPFPGEVKYGLNLAEMTPIEEK